MKQHRFDNHIRVDAWRGTGRKWEMKTEKINACVHAWMHEGVRWGCAGTRDKVQL